PKITHLRAALVGPSSRSITTTGIVAARSLHSEICWKGVMGKRSKFPKQNEDSRDFWTTPIEPMLHLIPQLRGIRTFAEPCCGDGAMVRHLESFGLICVYAGDIRHGQDALAHNRYGDIDAIITNPPWTRKWLFPLIAHFQRIAPTWLLFQQDASANLASVPY